MLKKTLGEPTGREFYLQSLGLGTPGQNQGTQTANNTNTVNQAFANNTANTNNSLEFLQNWLGQNPSPVAGFGNITPPPAYNAGKTFGNGGNTGPSLSGLVQSPGTPGATGLPPAFRAGQPVARTAAAQ
jgi:hypothetical protein